MKHISKFLMLSTGTLLVIVLNVSSALAFQNEPNGFRGIKWGSNISEHSSEMTLIEGSKFYMRKNDKMSIGAAKLSAIIYMYYKERFQMVIIQSNGLGNKSNLLKTFRSQFGLPSKPNQFIEEYYWRGATTFISLKYNQFSKKCTATLASVALLREEQQAKAKAASEAGSDF